MKINFAGVNRLSILKDLKLEDITYQKAKSKVIINQVIDSDIKQYKEIRTLTKGQGEDYTTGCLLDHDYIISKIIIDL